jgi:hypothetical protein
MVTLPPVGPGKSTYVAEQEFSWLSFMAAWLGDLRSLPETCLQAEFFSQQFQRSLRQLFRVLAELPVKARMIVRVHAALKDFGIDGPIKEPRRDTQCANPIASVPSTADLIGLAGHVAGHDVERQHGL